MSEPKMTLAQLLDGLAEVGAAGDVAIGGLSLDSRRIEQGDVFVALAGAGSHGMRFIDDAVGAGAVAVLVDADEKVPVESAVPVVAVPELRSALAELARRMWNDPVAALDLVAVTGTNGKTSVAWLLAQALDGAMVGTLGVGRPGRHRKGTHTTPDLLALYRTLAALRDDGVATVVLEASSHALDQGRMAGLVFSSVIFTCLGHDHLDYHPDRASYGAAKSRLFTEFASRRQLINFDDEFGAELGARLGDRPELYGFSLDGAGRARAELISADRQGLTARIEVDERAFEVRTHLIGRVNLWNVLIVAIELAARGLSDQAIIRAVADLEPVPGRMQPVTDRAGRLAVIDYAHTPDALQSALGSVRELTESELWCVFGCGGDRDRAKRPRMGRIAESLADHVVLTDDNPRGEDGTSIIRAIQSGMERPERSLVIRDRARAIRHAIDACGSGDAVLVAGKGHETEQIVGGQRLPFDDAETARDALGVAA